MASDIHVLPIGDLREHEDGWRVCWCKPRVELWDSETGCRYPLGCALVVHNSLDGRELVERHGVQ